MGVTAMCMTSYKDIYHRYLLSTILRVHGRPPMPELPSSAKAGGSEGASISAHATQGGHLVPSSGSAPRQSVCTLLTGRHYGGLPDWVPLWVAFNVVIGQYGFGKPAPRSV